MAVHDQCVTDQYAIYHGDCCEVLPTLPAASVDLTLYSPPFAGLYNYSSSDRDISNARSYDEFMQHYEFVVREIFRLTTPGRVTAVHCMDVPRDGANAEAGRQDFPGDIIRLHERIGFRYIARYHVWKEPFAVRMRTLAKGLAHRQVTEDSTLCDVAHADYLLMFRAPGKNTAPVTHPRGFLAYAGSRKIPPELQAYRGWPGDHKENRYSHWIWRQYASAFWDDVRIDRVLPYEQAKDPQDERHVHPLQLDVIDRCLTLWSNPGEIVLTPFMGVGSEVYGAVRMGRRAIGVELKATYYRQALRNIERGAEEAIDGSDELELFTKTSDSSGDEHRMPKITARAESLEIGGQRMTTDDAIAFVRAELERAKHEHHDFNSGHEGYAVIREELDELWDAIKAEKQYRLYDGQTAYEAMQVAAMALRFLVDLCDREGLAAYGAGRRRP